MRIEGVASGDGFPELDGRRGMSAESLIRVLGAEAAERLMFYWGGTRVSVPGMDELYRVRMKERIRSAYENGATPAQVSERFGVSVRTAQRMRILSDTIERETEII
ncbi:Mor transcription activator family protein [Maridesulfovibrio sp. FT414]|uniref:Mor transcription activator family protein n=1 Tax=Maridesulfovibrio sp. FT414 TaxID=2979469 RepID=UPI003D804EDF